MVGAPGHVFMGPGTQCLLAWGSEKAEDVPRSRGCQRSELGEPSLTLESLCACAQQEVGLDASKSLRASWKSQCSGLSRRAGVLPWLGSQRAWASDEDTQGVDRSQKQL